MDPSNDTEEQTMYSDPKFDLIRDLIKDCFDPAKNNHSQILEDDYSDHGKVCPKTFDGLSCWDPTPAGSTAYQNCPNFLVGFDARRLSYKRCTENGTWAIHPEGVTPWTNYTTCVNVEDLEFRSSVNLVYVVGYTISVISLLLSIGIFLYQRSLQCTRIRIHIHLFKSFAINNILWILWHQRVVETVSVVQNNVGWCQILHIVTHYFMVSSYIWMFCEGLHLHISLVIVFVKEDLAMAWFKALGWGLSFIIVMIYAIVRYNTPGATERCWMDYSDTFWIIIVPVVASLVASLVFLINVIRVLVTKLRPTSNQDTSVATKKAVRATLILIPLFGLHFMMIPLRPPSGTLGEKIYDVFSAVLTSSQGFCVAALFCFTNHDVVMVIRSQFKRYFRKKEVIFLTGVTGGESLANTRENVV